MSKVKNGEIQIKLGTCILEENPFVYALKSKYRTDHCDFCFVSGKLLKCSNCLYVFYCNKFCQKEAWPIHKRECHLLRRISPRILPDAARLLCRIILHLNNGGDFDKGFYTYKDFRRFKDLMTHSQSLKSNKKRLEHIESLYQVLRQMMSDCLLPNENEFLCIYGRMIVNSFNILDLDMNSIGSGIYLGVSITDHSCKPNAVATFEGTKMFLRAIEDMPKLDWSKIFISYIDLLDTTENRQKDLEQNYFFLCDCLRCKDIDESNSMNTVICPNKMCKNAIYLGDNSTECIECCTLIPSDYQEKWTEVVDFTKTHLDNMNEIAYLDVCQLILKKQIILHSNNVWRLKTLDMAFESAIGVGKWDAAVEYGNELVKGLRKYCGLYNPILGIAYMKIGKILLLKNDIDSARANLKKSLEIISITHGKGHSLYRTRLLPLLMETELNDFC